MATADPIDVPDDTETLLRRAGEGDGLATSQLLRRHQARLKRMVAVRLDDRLATRVDPSDVVQETLIEAAGQLPQFALERPMPFYPWLRRLAAQRISRMQRSHLDAAKRAVAREAHWGGLPDRSAWQLAERIVNSETGPQARVMRAERRRAVHDALLAIPQQDREVLVLRYLEQLGHAEIAEVLELSEGAVKMRQLRALRRMRSLLDEHSDD